MEKGNNQVFLFLLFLLIGLLFAVGMVKPVKEKIAREEEQTNTVKDVQVIKEQIVQIQDTISRKASIEYVNVNDKRVKDEIIIKTYEPTADCIEVEMEIPSKIRLDCVKR